mmetsp:Transcript_28892/g.78836  ORF Transcript_28892/g.78836 Transcript_28892/m.78836 type:complete len:261 (-) Transcript_28892:3247-4029(-)
MLSALLQANLPRLLSPSLRPRASSPRVACSRSRWPSTLKKLMCTKPSSCAIARILMRTKKLRRLLFQAARLVPTAILKSRTLTTCHPGAGHPTCQVQTPRLGLWTHRLESSSSTLLERKCATPSASSSSTPPTCHTSFSGRVNKSNAREPTFWVTGRSAATRVRGSSCLGANSRWCSTSRRRLRIYARTSGASAFRPFKSTSRSCSWAPLSSLRLPSTGPATALGRSYSVKRHARLSASSTRSTFHLLLNSTARHLLPVG